MNEAKILEQTYSLFSNERKRLIEKLRAFDWENSVMSKIYEAISTEIAQPILARGDLDEEIKYNDFQDKFGDKKTGDISDNYTIVTNDGLNDIVDWDFTDYINNCEEIRFVRLWINWYLPVYYFEVNFERGIENGSKIEYGTVDHISAYEQTLVETIESILTTFNFYKCELSFLKQKVHGVQTDLIEDSPTLFECLFSDLKYYWDEVKTLDNRG